MTPGASRRKLSINEEKKLRHVIQKVEISAKGKLYGISSDLPELGPSLFATFSLKTQLKLMRMELGRLTP